MEACIKFVKCTIKKCRQTNNDVHFAFLQKRSTLIGARLPCSAMMLFNRTRRTLLPQIGREPINFSNDGEYYETLKSKKEAYTKNNDTHKDSASFSIGSTITHLSNRAIKVGIVTTMVNDKAHVMDTQQDDAWVNNPSVPRLED